MSSRMLLLEVERGVTGVRPEVRTEGCPEICFPKVAIRARIWATLGATGGSVREEVDLGGPGTHRVSFLRKTRARGSDIRRIPSAQRQSWGDLCAPLRPDFGPLLPAPTIGDLRIVPNRHAQYTQNFPGASLFRRLTR